MDSSASEEARRNGWANVGSQKYSEQCKRNSNFVHWNKQENQGGYALGFANLSNAVQKLTKQSEEQLSNKGLNYRQQWLRPLTAHREFQERLREKNEAPEEIQKAKGEMWWIRNGKPPLEEYRAMGF